MQKEIKYGVKQYFISTKRFAEILNYLMRGDLKLSSFKYLFIASI